MDEYDIVDKSKFIIVGKSFDKMDEISRPSLSYWKDVWRKIKKNKIAFAGLVIIIVYTLLAIFGPYMTKYNYFSNNSKETNLPMFGAHWFGTDSLGRDLWSRVWLGARVSLMIGFVATLVNTILGTLIGGIAGYYGGKVDMIITRIIDVFYGIPYIIVAILVMVVLGAGIMPLIIAMVIVGWIGTARLIRGEVIKIKEQDYVAAAKILGVSNFNIIFKNIVPNIMGLIITNWTLCVPTAIFTEAFLSYIGLGIQPPDCSWGELAKAGSRLLKIYPYQLFIPAFFISTMMLALNLLGDGLRDAFDPKLRRE